MSKKKNENLAVGFCLDESGSMGACWQSTISGFNEWLDDVRKQPGKTTVTVTKFSSGVGERHRTHAENVAVAKVPKLSGENYTPRGNTPLYDAVGFTIRKLDNWLAAQGAEWPVMFVIQTDGQENASREFTREQVFELIQAREREGWKFIYLGANQDEYTAAQAGAAMGMSVGSTMSYDYGASAQTVSSLSTASASMKAGAVRTSADLLTATRQAAEEKLAAQQKPVEEQKSKDEPKDTSTPNF